MFVAFTFVSGLLPLFLLHLGRLEKNCYNIVNSQKNWIGPLQYVFLKKLPKILNKKGEGGLANNINHIQNGTILSCGWFILFLISQYFVFGVFPNMCH